MSASNNKQQPKFVRMRHRILPQVPIAQKRRSLQEPLMSPLMSPLSYVALLEVPGILRDMLTTNNEREIHDTREHRSASRGSHSRFRSRKYGVHYSLWSTPYNRCPVLPMSERGVAVSMPWVCWHNHRIPVTFLYRV